MCDLYTCVTWHMLIRYRWGRHYCRLLCSIHTCDMTHICVTHENVWHDTRASGTRKDDKAADFFAAFTRIWLTYVCDSYSCADQTQTMANRMFNLIAFKCVMCAQMSDMLVTHAPCIDDGEEDWESGASLFVASGIKSIPASMSASSMLSSSIALSMSVHVCVCVCVFVRVCGCLVGVRVCVWYNVCV